MLTEFLVKNDRFQELHRRSTLRVRNDGGAARYIAHGQIPRRA